jgi:hypothetical protein
VKGEHELVSGSDEIVVFISVGINETGSYLAVMVFYSKKHRKKE